MPSSRRKSIRRTDDIGFQMAPMIDVVFLLLIFFICTTQFPEFEGKFEVRLPDPGQVRKAAAAEDVPEEVIIRITDKGQFMVNEAERTEQELAGLLKLLADMNAKQAVIIDGDPVSIHKYVVRVLNACYQAGISNISFAALREE